MHVGKRQKIIFGASGKRVGDLGDHSGGSACGRGLSSAVAGLESGIMRDGRIVRARAASIGWVFRSRVFVRKRPCAGCSVIRLFGSSVSIDAQKRFASAPGGPKGAGTTSGCGGSRPAERGLSLRSGARRVPHGMPRLRHPEARAARFSGRQCALHQALCSLWRTPLAARLDPRRCRGATALAAADGRRSWALLARYQNHPIISATPLTSCRVTMVMAAASLSLIMAVLPTTIT